MSDSAPATEPAEATPVTEPAEAAPATEAPASALPASKKKKAKSSAGSGRGGGWGFCGQCCCVLFVALCAVGVGLGVYVLRPGAKGTEFNQILNIVGLGAPPGKYELTEADWDEKTAGKTVFVKFFAPWCGHCKQIKPDWEKLMAQHEGNATVLVAEVDCVGVGASLCETFGVQGFPTIKYGDPNNLEDYSGGRDFASLSKFTKKSLGPRCGPKNLDLCTEAQRALVEQLLAVPEAELQKKIGGMEAEMAAVDKELEALLKSLQAKYEDAKQKKDAKMKEIKDSGHGLMKAVLNHRVLRREGDEL